jgi:hypothetical protein
MEMRQGIEQNYYILHFFTPPPQVSMKALKIVLFIAIIMIHGSINFLQNRNSDGWLKMEQ